ncbi:MAG: hydrolase [Acidobacteria bacterium]|nr:MAG: hydrolase [Bacteroidota bacterium]RLE26104.1 MAG: hydrolase [Acidobacteriota bacterium]
MNKKVKILILSIILSLDSLMSFSQKVNHQYNVYCNKIQDEIAIDGILDEKTWQKAVVAKDFHMIMPMDTSLAKAKTEVRVAYDNKNFYLSAICYLKEGSKIVVSSMKRDFSFGSNDNFFCVIDPFNDLTNGFSFGANAVGGEWDGDMADGGRINLNWDNKWKSIVKNYEDKWIFEAAIPFKTLRYKKGMKNWGINFSRLDLSYNEKSAWAKVPRQFSSSTLAFTGNLVWEEPPPRQGTNISLIPYGKAAVMKDLENNTPTEDNYDIGLDAKISLTPALNLDLTVNPDFSQVEVDRQVTNLSRFELFFPERRQFFLENSDLFANFGFKETKPFFSRRIGLNAPIEYGGRLSGKLDENWRIGVMDLQTSSIKQMYSQDGSIEQEGIPNQNFFVAALQRKLFTRSSIQAIFINKESFGLNYQDHDSSVQEYNRNVGLEYNLASKDNLWKGKLLVHKSFSPHLSGDDYYQAANLEYDTKNMGVELTQQYVGENYNSEVGFIPRNGYHKISPEFRYSFFPKSGKLNSHGPELETDLFWDKNYVFTDISIIPGYLWSLLDRSSFGVYTGYQYVRLLEPFDPTNSDGPELAAGSDYNWWNVGFVYSSAPQNLFTYEIEANYGGYFNGQLTQFIGSAGYRFQPFANINIDIAYNDISLPEPYKSTSYLLISPRLEVTFTKNMYLTTFVQFNEQAENVNLNARFRWRFLPASDIYIVYTENYRHDNFSSKNRALVFKITYWYNI